MAAIALWLRPASKLESEGVSKTASANKAAPAKVSKPHEHHT